MECKVQLSEKQTVAEALKTRIKAPPTLPHFAIFSPLVSSGLDLLKPETLEWASGLDRASSRECPLAKELGRKQGILSEQGTC